MNSLLWLFPSIFPPHSEFSNLAWALREKPHYFSPFYEAAYVQTHRQMGNMNENLYFCRMILRIVNTHRANGKMQSQTA